jgi:DNA-binding MarR family transcriptional regulator
MPRPKTSGPSRVARAGAEAPSVGDLAPFDGVSDVPVEDIVAAWRRERPGAPTEGIPVVTLVWRLGKLLADERRRVLAAAGVDAATLDLLSVLRRSGPPYTVTTRALAAGSLVTAGAISQRVARAEREGLVTRAPAAGRAVAVSLTPLGHAVIERVVDDVLGREAELVAGLPERERQRLVAGLSTLLTDVRERLAAGD